jgi:hypothetical protein
VSVVGAALPRRALRIGSATVRHLLPPTLYFFAAFNLISFTTDVMVHNYWFHISSVILASMTALVVAKVVLVVDKVHFIDRFRGRPLIQPILYKSIFYSLVVLVVRFIEKIIDFALDAKGVGDAFRESLYDFTWHKFIAVHLWIFICFVIYVTATELVALLGEGQLFRLFFRHRSSEHRLTRRRHVRALMELSRLAETTPRERLFDPATPQGRQLITVIDALRQRPA